MGCNSCKSKNKVGEQSIETQVKKSPIKDNIIWFPVKLILFVLMIVVIIPTVTVFLIYILFFTIIIGKQVDVNSMIHKMINSLVNKINTKRQKEEEDEDSFDESEYSLDDIEIEEIDYEQHNKN